MIALRTVQLGRRLGQPPASEEGAFRVVVVDARGNPFPEAHVAITSSGRPLFEILSDAQGEVRAPVSGTVDVQVDVRGFRVVRRGVGTEETLFVVLPVCAPGPVLTKVEMGLFAAAAALAGAGSYWKLDLLKLTGEVLFGATVFTAVYRNSCST